MLIVADDLIWSSRLAALARAAGAEPTVVGSAAALDRALDGPLDATGQVAGHGLAVVDLTARGYDPLAAIAAAAARGRRVVCIGQHDDAAARKAALAAGAAQVLAYRKLADDGPAVMAAWLAAAEE